MSTQEILWKILELIMMIIPLVINEIRKPEKTESTQPSLVKRAPLSSDNNTESRNNPKVQKINYLHTYNFSKKRNQTKNY